MLLQHQQTELQAHHADSAAGWSHRSQQAALLHEAAQQLPSPQPELAAGDAAQHLQQLVRLASLEGQSPLLWLGSGAAALRRMLASAVQLPDHCAAPDLAHAEAVEIA